MAKIIGIDLGTSNSAAAVLIGGKPTIIPSAEGLTLGGKAFPSVVAFTKDGQRLVGEPARRQAISNPDRTITAIKRKMGTSYKLEIDGIEYDIEVKSGQAAIVSFSEEPPEETVSLQTIKPISKQLADEIMLDYPGIFEIA